MVGAMEEELVPNAARDINAERHSIFASCETKAQCSLIKSTSDSYYYILLIMNYIL